MDLSGFYERNYKVYILFPLILFIVFFGLIFVFPGIEQGIDFKGGTSISLKTDKEIDPAKLKALLEQNFELVDLSVTSISGPTGYGVIIQFVENTPLARAENELKKAKPLLESNPNESVIHSKAALELISNFVTPTDLSSDPKELFNQAQSYLSEAKENFTVQLKNLVVKEFALNKDIGFEKKEVGAALGAAFWDTALFVGVVALILIIIVVFIFFREIIPSMAIIAAAIFDITSALALMSVFKVSLSLSSIPALLMLVGYSVDTDVMLTTRLLMRKEKTPAQRTVDAMKTGLTMTFTTLAALIVMITLSYLSQIAIILEIGLVLLFGLAGDIISTWFMNAPVLLWYVEKKKTKRF